MWVGGVRVVIPDEEGRILMVCQHHEGKDIWMVPGGAVEEGESSKEAALREVLEETGLVVRITELLWHVEEVSASRGQRFVLYFLAEPAGGNLNLGTDPELGRHCQVLRELHYLSRNDLKSLAYVHPDCLRNELWDILEAKRNKQFLEYSVYRMR